jgi:predicted Zn finger-like uncharacterized protein
MDVRCNRCGTDYEFDDTLISDRGTTVQCTNCGYQFKIYPQNRGSSAPERWRVTTASGKEHVYTSLRDLQRAIGEHKVGPRDLLSRGAEAPRPLGAIPELEPFFASTTGPSRGLQSVPRTLHGVAPPPSGTPRPSPNVGRTQSGLGGKMPFVQAHTTDPGGFSTTLPAGQGSSGSFEQSSSVPRVLGTTLPSALPATTPNLAFDSTSLAGPPAAPSAPATTPYSPVAPGGTLRMDRGSPSSFDSTLPATSPTRTDPRSGGTQPSPEPPTSPFAGVIPPPEPVVPARPAPPPAAAPYIAPAPITPGALPAGPRSSPRSSPRQTPPVPGVMSRERLPSYDDLPEEPAEAGRRATSRWIAGVVILAVAGLLAATVGHKYLARFSNAPKPVPSARDTRAAGFLAEGMRLLEEAQYDEAQIALVKAQALADRDPAVLSGLAKLETLRAETFWLKLRLLDPTATALVQSTERELADRVAKARKAVDAAFAVAPEDPSVIRARVNVLRIAGEEGKAREWIQPVAANPADPQNAYVLAALDLAEAAPAWSTVIDRLRAAAVSGKDVGRARATLIYALVRAGRVVEAGTELAKVENADRPHPLLPELKGFVARFSTPLDAGVADAAASVDAAAPPGAAQADGAVATEGVAAAAPPTGDFRRRLTQAAAAVNSGELSRAEQLYQSVLNEHPGNTEALAGLADVARRRNDTATATKLYADVLEANPSYLPALMATADQKWQAGDRKGAIALYRRVLEQAGPSTDYGQRAQARIAQGEGGDQSSSKPSSPPTSTPAEPPPSKPEIDTSDLPGVTPP